MFIHTTIYIYIYICIDLLSVAVLIIMLPRVASGALSEPPEITANQREPLHHNSKVLSKASSIGLEILSWFVDANELRNL